MPWVVKGKIAGHFPGRSNPNLDVAAIGFIPAGSNQSANDIKNIKAVYFVPAGINPASITQNNLNDYLVWIRYWEESSERLLAEDTGHYVLMKYSPTISDITVSSIGILTKGSGTNGRCVYILDENGILIGKSTGNEAKVEDTTIHGYTATKRTTTFDTAITLKVGKDYWIQYYFENCDDSPDAYYLNEQGTEYKNLELNNYYNATPIDMSTLCYKGTTSGNSDWLMIDEILSSSVNDVWKTSVQASYPVDLNNQPGDFYTRTNSDSGSTYKGIIHHQSDSDKPTAAETTGYSTSQYVMVKNDSTTQGQHFKFYKRNSNIVPSGTLHVQDWEQSDSFLPNLLLNYNTENTKFEFTGNGAQYNYNFYNYASHSLLNYIYVIKNNLNIKYSDLNNPITSEPQNPADNDVYLKTGSNWTVGTELGWQKILVYYKNSSWHNFSLTDGNLFTEISSLWDSVDYSDIKSCMTRTNPQPTIIDITQTQSDYIKHYLEINGNEVT